MNPSTTTLRLGVLGCGMIGQAYLRQARTVPGLEVTAVCSRSAASRPYAPHNWPSARIHADRAALLADPNINAVLVCTPHNHHAADAAAALTAGKHVLIEKPIATSTTDLDDLEAAAACRPELSVLALPLVDTQALNSLRECCDTSIIGPIMELASTLDVPGPPRSNWYYSREAAGGPSLDTLPYALARLLALTGPPTKADVLVSQAIKRRLCLDGGSVVQQVEDQITLQLAFPFGQQALVKSSWCISRPEDYLLVRGRHGDVRLDCWRNTLLMRSRLPPTRPHHLDTWDGEPAYRITLPKSDPEYEKLATLAALVAHGSSAITQTAYATRLILAALDTSCGQVPLPPPVTEMAPRVKPLNMGIGPEYV
jgi:predicted dehydrogenase